jgi:hypothetical protein
MKAGEEAHAEALEDGEEAQEEPEKGGEDSERKDEEDSVPYPEDEQEEPRTEKSEKSNARAKSEAKGKARAKAKGKSAPSAKLTAANLAQVVWGRNQKLYLCVSSPLSLLYLQLLPRRFGLSPSVVCGFHNSRTSRGPRLQRAAP